MQAGSSPPGGSFKLALAGQWTSALPWDVSAQAMQTALQQQVPIPGGLVEVDKTEMGHDLNYTITFVG